MALRAACKTVDICRKVNTKQQTANGKLKTVNDKKTMTVMLELELKLCV